MDCVFCQIVTKKVPAHIIFQDPNNIAFLDNHPRSPGHALVIPKRHAKTILDFSSQELANLFGVVGKVTKDIEKTFQTNMATIGINYGELSGIPHLHIHIIPRFTGDGGGIIQSVVYNKPKESLSEIAERVRKNIKIL